jgi:putative N6-adenine-specific DNA methylase
MGTAMLLNLCLRTGQRVLFLLHEGHAGTPGDLYDGIVKLPWEDILHEDGYVCITSSVDTPEIRDARFANLKAKDAIVDRLRNLFRRRPDSGSDRTGAVVHVYWKDDLYRIFADTSGEPLSRRGYRKIPLTAPMQETLAAAVIMATGWTGDVPLINPMCGSGTLAIEAALIARRRAPGLLRDNFGFLHLKGFDDDLWQQVRLKVRKGERKEIPGKIIATDISLDAVRAAGVNAGRAKMGRHIQFRQCPFEKTAIPAEKGIVVLNPPYGQRLGEDTDLAGLYEGIGDFFKARCEGYRGYIFTASLDLTKKVGLRTSRRVILYNGELESRLLEYEIYEGSKKQPAKEEKGSGAGGHLPAGDGGAVTERAAGRAYARITSVTDAQTTPDGTTSNRRIVKGPKTLPGKYMGASGPGRFDEPKRIIPRRIVDRNEKPVGKAPCGHSGPYLPAPAGRQPGESGDDLKASPSAPVFTGPTLRSDDGEAAMALSKGPDNMPGRATGVIDAGAHPDRESAPVRRAPVRRRVIPKG